MNIIVLAQISSLELFSIISALTTASGLVIYTLLKSNNKTKKTSSSEMNSPQQDEYDAIRNNMPIGVLTVKVNGALAEYNQEAKRLVEITTGKIEQFNLFSCDKYLNQEEISQLKNKQSVDKKLILKTADSKKSYLRLIIYPFNGSHSGEEFQFFIIDDSQNANQRKEINDANALFSKALIEAKIGICRFNLFDNTGFATTTWYENMAVKESTSIAQTFCNVKPEDYKNIEGYIHEIQNIQFNEEAFLTFAEKNFFKTFSCTIQVIGNDRKNHYFKLYSEISKYDPDGGEIIADFITINIDDHIEKEQILEQTYIQTKEAEELKQSFIVNMSQEISTPLNAITLACRQLFVNTNPKEEQYTQEKVELNTNKLLGIINSIVEISKDKIVASPQIIEQSTQTIKISNNKTEAIQQKDPTKEKVLLIAEDNDNNFQLLRYMIKNKYKIVHAWNGEEAVQMYKDIHPDLILMDIKMPLMTGYQATEAIRNLDGQIPIIAVTAYAFENDKNKILNSGFNAYLSKPVNEMEMFKLFNKYL